MNEEAREKAWWRFSDARQAPRIADSEIFESGWDAARTFSAEDVERVADVIHANHAHMRGEFDGCRDLVCAVLAAIGTVEEAQFRGTRCGECGMFSDWHQPMCSQYPPTRLGTVEEAQ